MSTYRLLSRNFGPIYKIIVLFLAHIPSKNDYIWFRNINILSSPVIRYIIKTFIKNININNKFSGFII